MRNSGWKLLGTYKKDGRVSYTWAAVAIVFASETFLSIDGPYPIYMSVLALVTAGYVAYRAVKAKSVLGFTPLLLALLWLNPLFGGTLFDSMNTMFFLAHAGMALLLAGATYSFMRGEHSGK